jgi:azurin
MEGVRSDAHLPLLHSVAYFTLNQIPAGERALLALPPPVAPEGQTAAAPSAPERATRSAAARAAAPAEKRVTWMPASWNGKADVSISVGTQPGLRFSVQRIDVQAGSRVQLSFTNTDDMLHNLVIVGPGTADAVGQAAMALGLEGAAHEYVPLSRDVLHHTSLLQPGQAETIYFTAPATPGEYTYVCTYPGHHILMRGVLRVTS